MFSLYFQMLFLEFKTDSWDWQRNRCVSNKFCWHADRCKHGNIDLPGNKVCSESPNVKKINLSDNTNLFSGLESKYRIGSWRTRVKRRTCRVCRRKRRGQKSRARGCPDNGWDRKWGKRNRNHFWKRCQQQLDQSWKFHPFCGKSW